MNALDLKSKDRKVLYLLDSRLKVLKENIQLGVISSEYANIELNKIRSDLFDLYDSVHRTDLEIDTQKRKVRIALASFVGLILISFFSYSIMNSKKNCEDIKTAVLIADFQNTERESETDGFANSLVTRIDNSLDDRLFDVRPVGHQTRKVKRYDDYIRKEFFDSSCDTSGLFINGFLSLEQKVFNAYITLSNLTTKIPGFSIENSLTMDNPSGIEFSVSNDARVLADLVVGILRVYEGEPYDALKTFLELEKADKNDITRKDRNFIATIAHFKGNCYAMRGDNVRAKEQYKIVQEYGNAELRQVADSNSQTADEVSALMEEDPEMKKKANQNKAEHSKFEKELVNALNSLGKEFDKLLGRFGKK